MYLSINILTMKLLNISMDDDLKEKLLIVKGKRTWIELFEHITINIKVGEKE